MSFGYDATVTKTRKEHRCWGCGAIIPQGASAAKSVSVDCGKMFSSYWCQTCQDIMAMPGWTEDDMIGEGELRTMYPEMFNAAERG